MSGGFVETPLLVQRNPQVLMRLGVAGPKPQCLLVVLDRLGYAALSIQSRGQVVVGLWGVRLYPERLAIVRNRLREPSLSVLGRTLVCV